MRREPKNMVSYVCRIIMPALMTLILALLSCSSIDDAGSYLSYTIKEKLDLEIVSEDKETNLKLEEEEIILPPPELKSEVSLEEALAGRRSLRSFSSQELSPEEISQLLWAAQGITRESTGYRTAPSAGALYPLEIFLLKSDGAYHYIPDGHKLIKINPDDLRMELVQGVLFQEFTAEAPVNIIITAVFSRTTAKYGSRGERYVYIEAGHSCQNILLQAAALGMVAVPIGAFDDSYIQNMLDLSKDYQPIYVIPVGYPG